MLNRILSKLTSRPLKGDYVTGYRPSLRTARFWTPAFVAAADRIVQTASAAFSSALGDPWLWLRTLSVTTFLQAVPSAVVAAAAVAAVAAAAAAKMIGTVIVVAASLQVELVTQ